MFSDILEGVIYKRYFVISQSRYRLNSFSVVQSFFQMIFAKFIAGTKAFPVVCSGLGNSKITSMITTSARYMNFMKTFILRIFGHKHFYDLCLNIFSF